MSSPWWDFYTRLVRERLGPEAARLVEDRAKIKVRTLAWAVLRVLANRGIEVPEDVRARIVECDDWQRLEVWLDRAVNATSIDDLFRPGPLIQAMTEMEAICERFRESRRP